MSDVSAILAERGSRYGRFDAHALVTQRLKQALSSGANWDFLEPDAKEALEMIVHKIGRVLNGDPDYDDSWKDIAGYAQLIVDRINRTGEYAVPTEEMFGAPTSPGVVIEVDELPHAATQAGYPVAPWNIPPMKPGCY